ncbi:hypothetical protein B0H13DRAFT_2289592 [Mycena leptocephala]|nr:hypothetical protein B0H13DRAFT_2289592 [Mycena leptocephala]
MSAVEDNQEHLMGIPQNTLPGAAENGPEKGPSSLGMQFVGQPGLSVIHNGEEKHAYENDNAGLELRTRVLHHDLDLDLRRLCMYAYADHIPTRFVADLQYRLPEPPFWTSPSSEPPAVRGDSESEQNEERCPNCDREGSATSGASGPPAPRDSESRSNRRLAAMGRESTPSILTAGEARGGGVCFRHRYVILTIHCISPRMRTPSSMWSDLVLDSMALALALEGRRDDLNLRLCACMMSRMEARPSHIDPGFTSIDGDGQRDASLPRTCQALPIEVGSAHPPSRREDANESVPCCLEESDPVLITVLVIWRGCKSLARAVACSVLAYPSDEQGGIPSPSSHSGYRWISGMHIASIQGKRSRPTHLWGMILRCPHLGLSACEGEITLGSMRRLSSPLAPHFTSPTELAHLNGSLHFSARSHPILNRLRLRSKMTDQRRGHPSVTRRSIIGYFRVARGFAISGALLVWFGCAAWRIRPERSRR